ncbi:MAG TPA: GTPase, partial [Emticicia sp.]
MANIVAIVGRPNVGKSTLFNRLIESRVAITDNMPGVTRDRHYGQAVWTEKYFTVIDTGGYVVGSEDTFEGAIRDQVEIAIEESSVILFVVDTMTGLTDLDKDFANILRRSKKPVFVVANKAETFERQQTASEFYEMGLGEEIFAISAADGGGTGDLLDEVVKAFEDDGIENPNEGIPRIAILG